MNMNLLQNRSSSLGTLKDIGFFPPLWRRAFLVAQLVENLPAMQKTACDAGDAGLTQTPFCYYLHFERKSSHEARGPGEGKTKN